MRVTEDYSNKDTQSVRLRLVLVQLQTRALRCLVVSKRLRVHLSRSQL